eukprot:TRINITY_DN61247_c0_g1_i1.p1 TRINITY_DN61247_c0_g1~~TRINITY_DN61247_c0_g1_i1.p1  ORF type:complete len:158 (-),score=6.17 TRINITY_DN61247_c0_g1_i1:83-556(-)
MYLPSTQGASHRLRPHKSLSAPALPPPGPGHYSPKKPLPGSPPGSFGRARRWDAKPEVTPGPDTYRKTIRELDRLWRPPRQPAFSVVPRRCGGFPDFPSPGGASASLSPVRSLARTPRSRSNSDATRQSRSVSRTSNLPQGEHDSLDQLMQWGRVLG